MSVLGVLAFPPSLETMIDPPTATQNVVVGQATPPSAWVPCGIAACVQVLPPSEDTSTSPGIRAAGNRCDASGDALCRCLVQVTPSSVVLLDERVSSDQVLPPLAEVKMTPCPTATQLDDPPQLTASSVVAPCGTDWLTHVAPSLDVVAVTPDPASVPPTAKHCETAVQVTALKFP